MTRIGQPFDSDNLPFGFRGLLVKGSDVSHLCVGTKSAVVLPLQPEVGSERRFQFVEDTEVDEFIELTRNGQLLSIKDVNDLTCTRTGIDVRKLRRGDERWNTVSRAIVELLAESPLEGTAASIETVAATGDDKRIIPVTELRNFYRSLRLLNATAIHQTICEYLAGDTRRAHRIGQMFLNSVRHFSQYANPTEPFHSRPENEVPESTGGFAFDLVAHFAQMGKQISFSDRSITANYVDRELSPFRSTRRTGIWTFENGDSGRMSGAGGLDLLLATDDGRPVIGEIKAETDSSAFFALIQALTYAAELVTASQTNRLNRCYPGRVKIEFPGTLDIILFCESADPDLKAVEAVANGILTASHAGDHVARYIARIACVHGTLPDDLSGDLHFDVDFCCGVNPESSI